MFFPLKRKTRWIAAICVSLAAFLMFLPSTIENDRLKKGGQNTYGMIVAKSCERKNFQTVEYKFQVGPEYFIGKGELGSGNPSCENLHIGDKIHIIYLNSRPTLNAPTLQVQVGWGWLFFAPLFLLFLLVWLNAQKERFNAEKTREA